MSQLRENVVLDIHDKPSTGQWLTLSLQHLFAMFGATILVPFLVDLSPAVALVSSGLGTIAFLLITKGKVPAYLGSSFAFIGPIISAKAIGGPGGAMMGAFLAGLVYGIVALIIRKAGYKWLMRLLPPIVVGPIIMVIGLALAGVAVGMATNNPITGEYSLIHFSAALVALFTTIIASVFFRGFFGLIPVLFGIFTGYIYSLVINLVDFSGVKAAAWIQAPEFLVPFVSYTPTFSWSIIAIMVPVAIVTLSEHIGHQLVLSKVIDKDLVKDPGLDRSILGDGVATMIAAVLGGPPNTTYGENIGVLAITRIYSIYVIAGAAVIAVIFGFVGKVTALISSIPVPVMGGVSILLFGIIASSGLRMMVDSKVDFNAKRNLIISSVILVIGIGGAAVEFEGLKIDPIALAAIIGILLNFILPGREKDTKDIFEEKEKENSVA